MNRHRRPLASESGFSLVEMLVSTLVMMTLIGAIFSSLNPARGTFRAQPEVSDMQQRQRVAIDSLNRDLVMAGAGTYAGSAVGSLTNYFAPIMPYRPNKISDVLPADPAGTFRSDTITLMYVPTTASQTTIKDGMPADANEIKVNPSSQCPQEDQTLCGFYQGMSLLVFDNSGSWNTFAVTEVQESAGHIQRHGPDFFKAYQADAYVTQISTHTYYLDRTTNQLMHFDGVTAAPIADNVVDLRFEYFGDPQPPMLRPTPPATTYGPAPPALGAPAPADPYGPGENCVFQVVGGQQVPRLPDLSPGSTGLVPLPETMLNGSDGGPWCPGTAADGKPLGGRFDADLFRIRQVRVTLRVQANLPTLRGTGTMFANPGTANRGELWIPDRTITFEVAPRNMNLGR